MSQGSIALGNTENLPDDLPDSLLDLELRQLGDALRASGNAYLFDDIDALNGGSWTTEWVEVALVANQLRQNYDFSQDLATLSVFTSTQALANPFFDEVSTLYNQLFLDRMDAGMNPKILGGNSLTIGEANYDFTDILGDDSSLLIGANERINLEGSINFSTQSPLDTKVVLASGGAIEIANGTDLKSALSDLVVSARQDVLMQEVALESTREIAIRSLRDIQLNQVTLNAVDRVHLQASQNLDVDGLQISQSLPSLIMEATTIRLSNVDFPSATSVQLNSLKGPIDGRYPNFGTAIPMEQQLGRVNFLNNVRSGGNLLNDRQSFDQHGGNISIGKLPNP